MVATCKELLGPYGRRLHRIGPNKFSRMPSRDLGALVRMLRRQEAMVELAVDHAHMPIVMEAISAGAGRGLEELHVTRAGHDEGGTEVQVPTAFCLIRLLQVSPDHLPVLRESNFKGSWRHAPNGHERLLELLGKGALPQLQRLKLSLDADRREDEETMVRLLAHWHWRRGRSWGALG